MSNFRQAYYGKLGYKGTEGKLEVLLDEKKVKDLNKLKLFAEYGVLDRGAHRLLLWGYLSSLFPIYPNNEKYVSEQRQQTFQDLRRAVRFLKLDENASKEQVFYTMWTIETNRLPFGGMKPEAAADCSEGDDREEEHPFIVIARAVDAQFPDAECHQVYWIAKAVYAMASQSDVDGLVSQIYSELATYDKSLLRDLENRNILTQIPMAAWLRRCFAGVIMPSSLSRVWDKLFGGSQKVLVFLMVKMLQYLRDKLLACDTYDDRVFEIFMHDQEAADRVVQKAIEMLEINNKK